MHRSFSADGRGHFSVSIKPATYSLHVSAAGFADLQKSGIRLSGQPSNLKLTLAVAANTTTVTVTAEDATLSADPGSNASAVVLKVSELSALADDPDDLAAQLTAMAGSKAGANGSQIYVDGSTNGAIPPKSAIRETRLNQNPFSAQFDRPGTGRVEIFTKAGTDKLHGSLSLEGMDRAFNTVTPFLAGASQPDYHQISLSARRVRRPQALLQPGGERPRYAG